VQLRIDGFEQVLPHLRIAGWSLDQQPGYGRDGSSAAIVDKRIEGYGCHRQCAQPIISVTAF
jgi:hypothetical protein